MPFDKLAYDNAYNREHYASISVRLDKEKVATFRETCKANGDSVKGVVETAIENYLKETKK